MHRVARQGSRRPTPVAQPLDIPLSAKGHDIGQTGSFTGVGLDSFRGRFFMLPDKLASMAAEKRARHGDKHLHASPRRQGPGQGPALGLRHAVPGCERCGAVTSYAMPRVRHGGRAAFLAHREAHAVGLGSALCNHDPCMHETRLDPPGAGTVRNRGAAHVAPRTQLLLRRLPADEAGDVNQMPIAYDASVHCWGSSGRCPLLGSHRPLDADRDWHRDRRRLSHRRRSVCLHLGSILSLSSQRPSMGRMTWDSATLQYHCWAGRAGLEADSD